MSAASFAPRRARRRTRTCGASTPGGSHAGAPGPRSRSATTPPRETTPPRRACRSTNTGAPRQAGCAPRCVPRARAAGCGRGRGRRGAGRAGVRCAACPASRSCAPCSAFDSTARVARSFAISVSCVPARRRSLLTVRRSRAFSSDSRLSAAFPAPRPSQRPAQLGVRHRRRHRPRRVHRANQTHLQLLVHRLGALQRMAQIPGLVGQRPDPLRLVAQAPRHVVVPHHVIEHPAKRRGVVLLLEQRLGQLADLAGLDFRARHFLAQPGDLPAQARDAVPVRRHSRGREQVVQTAHLGSQGERVLRLAAGLLRVLDRREPFAARVLELPLPPTRRAAGGQLR